MTLKQVVAACAASLLVGGAGAASAGQTIGAWSLSETVSPLTGGVTTTAQVGSNQALSDEGGEARPARLVMSCGEGVLAFYVAWPEVVNHDTTSLLFKFPETQVRYKLDAGPIKDDAWVISSDGAAAGSFDNLGARRLMSLLAGGRQFIVRMAGRTPQDAVFPIDGADAVLARLNQACGARPAGAPVAAAG